MPVGVRGAVCLCGLLGALLCLPVAASGASATSATSAATVATSTSPSSGGLLGGGLGAPGGITTPTTTTPTVISTATASSSGSGGLSSTSAIVIAIGAFVILGGISYFIWRDARRRAPVAARPAGESRENRPGSKAAPKARKLSAAERKRRKRGRAKR